MAKKPPAEPGVTSKPPGRPTKLTPELQAIVVEAVRNGHYVETATRLAKIANQTFYTWKQRGEKGEEPFAAFLDAIKEAEAEAQNTCLAVVHTGNTGQDAPHWTSAMTFMERRWPHLWGKRDPHRQELAGLEKQNKQLENELLAAKLAVVKAGGDQDARERIVVIVPDRIAGPKDE